MNSSCLHKKGERKGPFSRKIRNFGHVKYGNSPAKWSCGGGGRRDHDLVCARSVDGLVTKTIMSVQRVSTIDSERSDRVNLI